MKKSIILALSASIFLAGCYSDIVDSGQVGVELSSGKVNPNVLEEGWHLSINPMTDLDIYNTKSKRLEMGGMSQRESNPELIVDNSVTILTKDNLSIPVDVTILYKLNKSCAPMIRINYGPDITWDNKVIVPKARDIVRGVIGKDADVYKLNQKRELYAQEIQTTMNADIEKMLNVPNCVSINSVSIKNIRLPEQLTNSILKKQQTEEDVKIANLEIEKIKAQAQAEIEKNIGTAKAQEILAKSLTPAMIEWKRLEIEQQRIQKWNGEMPKVNAGGTNLLIDGSKYQ